MGIIKLKNVNEEQQENAQPEGVQVFEAGEEIPVSEEKPQEEQEQWDDPAVLHEDDERTDENSRHYILNNGTAKSVYSAEPTSFFDEAEKKWKQIDNSLEDKGDAFENKNGKFKTRISKAEQCKKVTITQSDKQLSWEYLGKQEPAMMAADMEEVPETVLKIHNDEETEVKSVNSSAVYENIEKDTDLEYRLFGGNLKENIIVREKSADYKYLFALNTKGLKLRLSEDNESLELYTEKIKEDGTVEEKVEFTIPSPYMYDANGVSSDDVYYELDESEDGKFSFAVVASEEWINAEERAFPVTIDPQIITSQNNLVEKQVYYRSVSTGSSFGSGTSYGNWYKSSSSYIQVSRTSYEEYKTELTIKRSLLNLMEGTISNVKLILTPYGSFSGSMYVNGVSSVYYYSSTGKLKLDITSQFKAAASDFLVTLTPGSYTNMRFDCANNPPVLEIEYLMNENVRPIRKTFTLAGIATGEVNLANGSMVTSVCDVQPEDSVMGLGIYHIHKRNAENYSLGGNFRLNLNETLIRYADGDYIYTDPNGDKHGFHDYYYYIDETGVKNYVTDKSKIVADAEGKLTYTNTYTKKTYTVKCEYKSTAGLKAMTKLEGIKNIKFLEQRNEDVKENQEKIDSYYNALKDYVIVNKSTGAKIENGCLKDCLDTADNFTSFMTKANSAAYLVLNESEAVGYLSSVTQLKGYNTNCSADNIVPGVVGINENMLSLRYSLYEISQTLLKYVNCDGFNGQNKAKIKDSLDNNADISPSSYSDVADEWKDSGENTIKKEDFDSQIRQRNLLLKQFAQQNQSLSEQISITEKQINMYVDRKSVVIEQLEKYYRDYLSLLAKREELKRQMPLNFLTDGSTIKGYNESGKLVAVYDMYENYAVIEYETYPDGENKYGERIARVYDNTEKQVLFEYNARNRLSCITDTRGRKTRFSYIGDTILSSISFDTGENLTIDYSGNNIYTLKEAKRGLKTYCYYSYNRPTCFIHYSMANNISVNGSTAGEQFIIETQIVYNPSGSYPLTSTTITDNLTAERYYFDANGNCTGYRKADWDTASDKYLVTEAEGYTHKPYWIGSVRQNEAKEVTVKAERSTLNKTPLDSYVFAVGETETTEIDQFNNAARKYTIGTLISEWIDGNGTLQQNRGTTTEQYTYDDSQRLIGEKITVTESNPARTVVSYVKYNYNAAGNVVRKESYVEGEEYTSGKTIEETVYDGKGNVKKTFTYNSLDTGSKFYQETEYDETGKVVSESDETGENKTRYGYIDGTDVVKEEVYPNGSKFAYGRDNDDTVTAITQSTEEGEENSTQKVYRCGELVELKSGNTDIRYTYNHKRKVKAVEMNGTAEYVRYDYEETRDSLGAVTHEKVTATYKTGEEFVSERDGNGNLLKYTANKALQTEITYDKKQQPVLTSDKITGKNYRIERDNLDKVTSVYEVDANGLQVSGGYGETYAYNAAGQAEKHTITGGVSQTYTYGYKTDAARTPESVTVNGRTVKMQSDVSGRNTGKEIYNGAEKIAEERITYRKAGDHATNMPCAVWFGDKTNGKYQVKESVRYAYDNMGNIEKVYENGELAVRYQYDALNRLIREDNKTLDKTYLFVYDNNGNIVKKREFAKVSLKDGLLLEEEDSKDTVYVYEGDRLVSYGGADFVYDVMGNPTTYRGKAAKWEKGRNLVSYGGHTFAYDGQCRRIAKDGISFTYDSNGNLIKQSNGLEFIYDHSGVFGVTYGGETYVYRKDAQGNVIALMNASGAVVARYLYDAWGTCVVVNNGGAEIADANHIGNLNPFRYRGYYYDVETKLYYLKTRYYDPEVGRFMTIDGIEYLDPETINGLNLYAYCGNNPVMNIDPEGTWSWKKFWKIFAVVAVGIVAVAAVAAITALSGGSLGAVLIGAGVGAFVSGGISAGIQWATTGTVDGGRLLVDAVVGGVLGAFGGSAIGQVGMTIAGGLTSAAGSVAGDWVAGEKVNYAKAAFSGALGALISFAGGAGAQNGELGAKQVALATKKQILAKNASGGYRHSTNFNFAMKSNARRIARVTKELNSVAIRSIIRSTVNMFELNVYMALVFA